jgi:DNA-binding IclR family transcriptional regulator
MPARNIRLDKNGVKVVRFFMDHPEREMSSEEISRSLEMDELDAGIILNSLEKAGFLEGKGKGLTYQYRVSGKVIATQINTSQDQTEGQGDDSTRYIG